MNKLPKTSERRERSAEVSLTNGRKLAHNATVHMTRPAFSVVIPQHWLAMSGELCSEVIA